MNLNKHTEFIRLSKNEPLTLACSALTDFLWEDFIGDARPSVTYLMDHYNVVQLSRFGKEVFERLYQGDMVTWLISPDDYEDYFRAKQNGEQVSFPRGYKPEHALWWAIMNDLSAAAAWPQLLGRSVGNQFNAGNNAVNILNQLSEVIEKLIEQQQFDVELLIQAGEQLEEFRKQYQEATAKGDKAAAEEARTKGKQLGQAIEDAVAEVKDKIGAQTSNIVDKTNKDSDSNENALSDMWGTSAGEGSHGVDLQEKKDLAKKLATNTKLKAIAKQLGALRRVWRERRRAKKVKASYESINGAVFSDDITRAYPVELALASSSNGRALFALKYSQKTLLTKDYTAHQKNLGKGPIVIYVDVSGSMSGAYEIWSKAISFVIAEDALKENREVQIHLFDTRVSDSVTLSSGRKNNKELLDFVGTWHLGGGTSFNSVIQHAVSTANVGDRADILMITDGHSSVCDSFIRTLNKFKTQTGTQWNTICLGIDVPDIVHSFSDDAYSVNLYDEEGTTDIIQKCIR